MDRLEHNAIWATASARVAGVRLRPTTLGQWRLLEAAASPFAWGGRASADAVRVALEIVSQPWRRTARRMRSPRLFALRCWVRHLWADASDAARLRSWLDQQWASPPRYRERGRSPSEAYPPCCGPADRLAMRALAAGVPALAPSGARTVWDATVAEALWACVCRDELAGAEYQPRGEAEELERRRRAARRGAR